jgi:predicted MFS family arabinose efflux permease
MSPHVSSPARYRAEDRVLFVFAPLIFLVLVMLGALSHFHWHPAGVLAVLCAAVLASPFVAMIVIVGLYLAEEKDEFQRSLFVRSILWGFGVTACVTVFWVTLGQFIRVPSINFWSGGILFNLGFLISFWVARWRYR